MYEEVKAKILENL